MQYTVTIYDMVEANSAVKAILPKQEPDSFTGYLVDTQLRIALESLSAEIGVPIVVPAPSSDKNPGGEPLEAAGTLPRPLLYGVAVPLASRCAAATLYPYKSMSEGSDSVTLRDTGAATIRDYKGVYGRYKHLVTPRRNRGV